MANFKGAKCEYCHKTFADSDDVVVCPDCGTPYHRECYLEAGECVNHELHEKGGEWSQFGNFTDEANADAENGFEQDAIRCPRCGASNPPTGLFCEKCGMPLKFSEEARPFNDVNNDGHNKSDGGFFGGANPQQPFAQPQTVNLSDVEIEGHKGTRYAKYVKNSFLYYVVNFFNMSKTKKKISFNLPAVFFPHYFFFYRKMYLPGILTLLFMIVAEIPSMLLYLMGGFEGLTTIIELPKAIVDKQSLIVNAANIFSFITLAVKVVCGLFANYWYFLKAKKDLDEIEKMDISDTEKDIMLVKKGGTSVGAFVLSLTVEFAAVMLAIIGLVLIFR